MATRVPETEAFLEEQILHEPASRTVSRLVDLLGSRLVAVVGNVKQTRTVREWIDGQGPQGNRLQILRFALQVAHAIASRFGRETAQSWFQGLNHHLLDRSPLLVLKKLNESDIAEIYEEEARVLQAVRNFTER